MRVGVEVGLAPHQEPGGLKSVVDGSVGVTDRLALEPGHGIGEPAVGAHRVEGGQVVLPAHLTVDLTERWSEVHDPGSLVGLDERASDHPPAHPGRVRRSGLDVVERAPVVQSDQRRSSNDRVGGHPLAEHLLDQGGSDDGIAHQGVLELGTHRRAGVGQQGPRRGGPGDERQTVEGRPAEGCANPGSGSTLVGQREANVGRLVLDLPVDVGLAEFVAAQRGAAPGAVGNDLDVLVEQGLVPHALQVRPHRLDIVRAEGPVGVVDVDPITDPLREGLPLPHVVADGLFAEAGELGDPHLLDDLALGRDAQLLLHLDLDREPVGVPPGLTRDGVAPHRAVPAEEVLVDAGPDMVQPRATVGRGRPFVEDPWFGPGPQLDGPLEDAVRAPPGQLLVLECGKIGFSRNRAEHGALPLHGGGGMVGEYRGGSRR